MSFPAKGVLKKPLMTTLRILLEVRVIVLRLVSVTIRRKLFR